ICHGAQVLTAAGVVQGRRVSAYPAVGPEVRLAGGEYADIPIDQAVTDGNLVTAPAWPAHPAWIAQFLEVLGTRIVHEEATAAARGAAPAARGVAGEDARARREPARPRSRRPPRAGVRPRPPIPPARSAPLPAHRFARCPARPAGRSAPR